LEEAKGMKYYAGIGARETPLKYKEYIKVISGALERLGYTLRSGGAEGADEAFEEGVENNKEIYLPYSGFRGRYADGKKFFEWTAGGMALAAQFHPAWDQCKYEAKKFHARNSHQVLGLDLQTPVDFVVCWTKNGEMVGGTSQALRIAQAHNIPIYNLGSPVGVSEIKDLIVSLKS
jgi:hypothetical protein